MIDLGRSNTAHQASHTGSAASTLDRLALTWGEILCSSLDTASVAWCYANCTGTVRDVSFSK